jgi:quinol monooxygenase YgiN
MIYRIVRMEFKPENKKKFIEIFYAKRENILAFQGCVSVELMEDKRDKSGVATFSIWENLDTLDSYRNSSTFQETWDIVKPLFSSKPQAWSYSKLMRNEND